MRKDRKRAGRSEDRKANKQECKETRKANKETNKKQKNETNKKTERNYGENYFWTNHNSNIKMTLLQESKKKKMLT